VDLGGTHIRVAITGPGGFGRLVVRRTAELPNVDGQGVLPGLIATIHETIAASGLSVPAAAIGVAVAAHVGPSGLILQSRPFGIPAGGAVRDRLSDAFGIPVVVDNDANLAAAAEVAVGAGRGLRDVAVITLGTNIGLGIMAEGRIVRGAHGAAGEAGTLLMPARRGRDGRADSPAPVVWAAARLARQPATRSWRSSSAALPWSAPWSPRRGRICRLLSEPLGPSQGASSPALQPATGVPSRPSVMPSKVGRC
jgi:glucokinase